MASDKLKYDQIADKDVFTPLRDEIEATKSSLDTLKVSLKELISINAKIAKETPLDGYDNLQKVQVSIGKVTTAASELKEVEKSKAALAKQVEKLQKNELAQRKKLEDQLNKQAAAAKKLREVERSKNALGKELEKLTKNELRQRKRLEAQIKKQADQIAKLTKSLSGAKKANEGLDKVEKDRLALSSKLEELTDDRIKANFELKEEIRLQTKELADNAKQLKSQSPAYDRLVKSVSAARLNFRNLSAELGENSEEATKAYEDFKKLDDQLRAVNRQTKKLSEAEKAKIALDKELEKLKKNELRQRKRLEAQIKKQADQIDKLAKALAGAKKENNEIDKVEKDRLALSKKLENITDDRTKANFELREEIRLQTKELASNAKLLKSQSPAYDRLVKNTDAAQLKFKNLSAQFGVNSRQARKAYKEFEKLDDNLRKVNKRAKDGKRDVGRYAEELEGLEKSVKAFGIVWAVTKGLELLSNAFQSNDEGAASLDKVMKSITVTFQIFVQRLILFVPSVITQMKLLAVEAKLFFAEMINIYGVNDDKVKDLTAQIAKLKKEMGGDWLDAFKGMGNEIAETVGKQIDLIDTTIKYRRQIIALTKDIASRVEKQAELQGILDNDTFALEEQIAAGQELLTVTRAIQKDRESIAAKNLKISQEQAKISKNNIEAQEAEAQALLDYNDLLAENVDNVKRIEKEINMLQDDAIERNLDFYLDDSDNRKIVNERIIADETQTYARRKALLEENLKVTEDTFNAETEEINKSLARQGKSLLDFEDLRKKTSSEEIARTVKAAGLSDRLAGRAIEIIRERRLYIQDNAESQRDLARAEQDSLDILKDTALTTEALNKLESEGVDLEQLRSSLATKRQNQEIQNVRDRVELAQEGSAEFIALNQQLNDLLLEQQLSRIEKEKENEIKRFEGLKELAENYTEIITSILEKGNAKRLALVDKEISAEEKRAQRLEELASQGNENAQENLAIVEKRRAQLQLARERELKKQQAVELASSAVEIYSSKIQQGDKNALASTVTDITLLKSFINSLNTFYEGTELVKNDLKATMPGKDGHIIRVDGNERIFSPGQNALVPKGMSNLELAMLAHNAGKSYETTPDKALNDELLKEIKELKVITANKPVYIGAEYDAHRRAIIDTIKTNNKIERRHKKTGGIWG